jgi:hypothetical protein
MREIIDLLHNRMVLVAIAALAILVLYFTYSAPQPLVFSRWNLNTVRQTVQQSLGMSQPVPTSAKPAVTGQAYAILTPNTPGSVALETYNQSSTLIETAANGSVQAFKRDLLGGSIAYIIVQLDGQTHLEVLTADGATLGSDASGDTIWTDHSQHLRTVEEMVRAPTATRPGLTLLGAMAFGFHGAERTSDEGTVVINNTIQRVNPGRAAICIRPDGKTAISVFNARQALGCAQAAGAGPVIMVRGKIANPAILAETAEFVPFNPLREDFSQLDWRKTVFTGDYPKTMVGIGRHANGHDYLVLLVSYNLNGIEAARQLLALGCSEAIGGDDDTSTQLVWRGSQVVPRTVRTVPTAIGIYAKTP